MGELKGVWWGLSSESEVRKYLYDDTSIECERYTIIVVCLGWYMPSHVRECYHSSMSSFLSLLRWG